MRLNPRKGNKNKGQQTPPAAAVAGAAASGGPGAAVAAAAPAVGVKVCGNRKSMTVVSAVFVWSTVSHSILMRYRLKITPQTQPTRI
jgi:hypothetical protein